jgi:hypothetical protein
MTQNSELWRRSRRRGTCNRRTGYWRTKVKIDLTCAHSRADRAPIVHDGESGCGTVLFNYFAAALAQAVAEV